MSAGFEGVDIHWICILDCPVSTGQPVDKFEKFGRENPVNVQ
jgi:hypothetical protein